MKVEYGTLIEFTNMDAINYFGKVKLSKKAQAKAQAEAEAKAAAEAEAPAEEATEAQQFKQYIFRGEIQ